MFAQLKSLLRKGDTVTLTVAIENDTQLRVNVFPKLFSMDGEQGGNRKALNTPLSVVATPEELDSPAFIETITRFTASVTGLRTNLDEAQAAHKAAAQSVSSAKGKKPEPTKQPEPPQPELPATAQAATPSLI